MLHEIQQDQAGTREPRELPKAALGFIQQCMYDKLSERLAWGLVKNGWFIEHSPMYFQGITSFDGMTH